MFIVKYNKEYVTGPQTAPEERCEVPFLDKDTALRFAYVILKKGIRRDHFNSKLYKTKDITVNGVKL